MSDARRATSQDVAKLAGVSRTTVSFILNNVRGVSFSEETRQKVLNAAKNLDYHPNSAGRKLVSGKSFTIGLVLNQTMEQMVVDAFLPEVLLGVEQAAIQEGYNILLKAVEPKDPSGYTRLVSENHVDGIILSGPRQSDAEIRRLHRDNVPLMLIGQLPGSSIPFVDADATMGAEQAVNHLIEQGHRCIGLITNAPLSYVSAQHRRDGYARALSDHGIEISPPFVREGNYTPASGYEAMTALLAEAVGLTAVFIASDVVAMGAVLAIKKRGLRIPEDIAIVGYDDIPLSPFFDPPLTTIHLPAYSLGWAASERLIRLVRGEGLDIGELLVQSKLVIRESSVKNSRSM